MYKPGAKVQKVMVQPINLIFRYLQNRSKIQVWLFENVSLRIEGHIIGELIIIVLHIIYKCTRSECRKSRNVSINLS